MQTRPSERPSTMSGNTLDTLVPELPAPTLQLVTRAQLHDIQDQLGTKACPRSSASAQGKKVCRDLTMAFVAASPD